MDDSERVEGSSSADHAAQESDGTGVPEGPKRPCPKCGSTKISLLTKDEEVAAFYESFGTRPPMAILTPPRRCRACGHRWEVIAPRFVLALAIGVFAIGFLIGVTGAIALFGMAAGFWGQPEGGRIPRSEQFRVLGFALALGGVATGSWFGIRYYWAKLRKGRESE
jgi:uncharacterized protein (DUF983 family)